MKHSALPRFRARAASVLCLLLLGWTNARAGVFPDYGYQPPNGWTGPTFKLSQDYPQTVPPTEAYPWLGIDFKADPQGYLQAIITYCFDGNVQKDFVLQDNTRRPWYHAPWLHTGPNAREFVRGLTHERTSRPYELAATQTQARNNYAVGMYNAPGGYIIGQVWKNPSNPNTASVSFPDGTVSFKLLFTTATAADAPFLAGSPEWVADINRSQSVTEIEHTKVRLLQIDVAAKDHRSSCGGWVFGTFHYDAAVSAATPWQKLRPLVLLWGDDPALTQTMYNAGQRPAESWINTASPIVQYRQSPPAGATPPRVLGWAGRGNGPVDNSVSSCLSCHSVAETKIASPMIPKDTLPESEKLRWFRNLPPGQAFDAGHDTLDFSLQLAVGIQNLRQSLADGAHLVNGVSSAPLLMSHAQVPTEAQKAAQAEYRASRDPEE